MAQEEFTPGGISGARGNNVMPGTEPEHKAKCLNPYNISLVQL